MLIVALPTPGVEVRAPADYDKDDFPELGGETVAYDESEEDDDLPALVLADEEDDDLELLEELDDL